jgi:misacylated tRNA(Ala) deacylase
LYFVAGQRVLDYLNRSVSVERSLSKLLSCGPEDHVECVERLQKTQKLSAKVNRGYLREIAQLLVYKHLHSESRDPVACIHRLAKAFCLLACTDCELYTCVIEMMVILNL